MKNMIPRQSDTLIPQESTVQLSLDSTVPEAGTPESIQAHMEGCRNLGRKYAQRIDQIVLELLEKEPLHSTSYSNNPNVRGVPNLQAIRAAYQRNLAFIANNPL
jgi:hypothetical protein